ncbi:MAG: riboflavin synthase subunit alpha [Candidatus Muproteobacteria bacterium RIFCSPHIGHO2_02_FULL_65_16]|uniref:Riboflavin synthase n=1 Tax=Candidatus Muproteobacteria bacterium RIFCSPHIGHO2_02_FULL_65_16 TaxID=1817766 RepID=A0A1F6U3J0_9PROT|nr:MAG: riboflavin synthase subunit alpha [Candidatus Muproteobacteria bacterium RIFCSPHIGHO2_02_FULL_65_16]
MFTGIVQTVGKIAVLESKGGDARVRVDAGGLGLSDVNTGDSIAVSGVCLTVVGKTAAEFAADVSGETLARTTLGALKAGDAVNLEKPLTPGAFLGGHLVSGHVDGVGRVLERHDDARSIRFRIEAPAALAKYIAAKGSICVDGVSLTVNTVQGAVFEANIIPHTAARTTLGGLGPGVRVNLEVDILARYLERLLLGDEAARPVSALTREFLARK